MQIFGDTYDLWVASSSLVRNADDSGAFGAYCPGQATYDSHLDRYPVLGYYEGNMRYYDCTHLEQLQYRNYATIVLGIWAVMQACFYMVAQGFCSTRYHVFDKIQHVHMA